MRQRCGNPKNQQFGNYGARGITITERWSRFENFLEDMGECPPGLTLERKNNDFGYFKENCKWDTRTAQARNTRATKLTFEQACAIALRTFKGEAYESIAKDFSISRSNVGFIASGEIWKDARKLAEVQFRLNGAVRKAKRGDRKISFKDAVEIAKLRLQGEPGIIIASKYGISAGFVRAIGVGLSRKNALQQAKIEIGRLEQQRA